MSGGDGSAALERLSPEQLRLLVRELKTRNAQLQVALDSRIVIEQAKGILMERHNVSSDVAFEALRRHARGSRSSLRSVADEVISGAARPV